MHSTMEMFQPSWKKDMVDNYISGSYWEILYTPLEKSMKLQQKVA